LETPLRSSRPELERHARLKSADTYAGERRGMEEGIAGPVRELDEAVPFLRIVPLQLPPNRPRGRFIELRFGNLRRDLGVARIIVFPLAWRWNTGLARSVTSYGQKLVTA
jgi:hypothetical protein